MAGTLISLIQPPNIDPSQAPTAFGRWAVPRFVRELQSPFLLRRQRALRALHDHLLSPEHVGLCYEAGLLDLVQSMYANEDDAVVRERCAACLLQFIPDERARIAMFESERYLPTSLLNKSKSKRVTTEDDDEEAENNDNDDDELSTSPGGNIGVAIIDTLLSRIDDKDERVRTYNHHTLYRLSAYTDGHTALQLLNVRLKLAPKLVALLSSEEGHPTIQCLILDCMHNLMQWDTQQFIAAHAVPLMVEFCEHTDAEIRRRAMRCAGDLSMPRNGKQAAVDNGLVEVLMHAVVDKKSTDADIRASALFALAMLTVLTSGKHRAVQEGAVKRLMIYLDDTEMSPGSGFTTSEIRLNAIKVLTCLAEAPEGRKELALSLPVIVQLKDDPNPHIRLASERLEKVILWKP